MSMRTAYLYEKDCTGHQSKYELCEHCLNVLDLVNENFISYDDFYDSWRFDLPGENTEVIVSVCNDAGDTPWFYTTHAWLCNNTWISDNEVLQGEVLGWKPFPKPIERSK